MTGYVGSWVGISLQQKFGDKYKIRSTVRSLKNQRKMDSLKEAFGEEMFNQIEFLEADLMVDEGLIKAI